MRNHTYCTCSICGSEGTLLDYNTKRRHERYMKEAKTAEITETMPADLEDAVTKEIFRITLQDTSPEEASPSPSCLSSAPLQEPSAKATPGFQTPTQSNTERVLDSSALLEELNNSPGDVHLLAELMNLDKALTEPPNLGKPCMIFETEKFFNHPLSHANPILVVAIFLVLILNVFGHLSRPWCNVSLRILKVVVKAAWCGLERQPTTREEYLLRYFPEDLRTVRKVFDMEPQTTTYAACPKCFALYEGQKHGDVIEYPARCNNKPTERSQPCRARLTTQHVQNGESVRVPLKPFVVQDFDAFVAKLLSRPGIEKELESRKNWQEVDELRDIQDGSSIQNLKGPDGKPFMRQTTNGELRLVWALCVDWFNPYQNKAAGKSASVGAIMMCCLNLPPHLRYKSENICLVALIPGPREPSREQINPLLRPIVSKLLLSWSEGTWFTRTCEYAKGRLVRSAIAASVNDLQATKKVNGSAAWPARYFCTFCLTERSNINDIDWTSWKARNCDKLREAAFAWKTARTKTARNKIFREHGVRWSELMQLPYWDPTRHIVVDGMHDLLLGLVQLHCRKVLGIDTPENKKQSADENRAELEAARSILSSNPTATELHKLRIGMLRSWCKETGTRIPGGMKSKKEVISAILSKNLEQSSEPLLSQNDSDMLLPHYIDDDMSAPSFKDAHLDRNKIKQIREHIGETTRPSWHVAPPPNLGEAKHGKLKADQWRSCIEFDLPVSLVKIGSSAKEQDNRVTHEKILQSTMFLGTAIRWATSHRTSKLHVDNYMKNMHAYLQSLLDMFPDMVLHPNHHNALHIGPQLLQFGPMHGWWTFPYERIIGVLQQYNTNSKIGELERTMLETFCVASNIKAFLQGPACPPILGTLQPILDACWNKESRGTLMQDIRSLGVDRRGVSVMAREDINWKKRKPLDDDVFRAFTSILESIRSTLPKRVMPDSIFKHDRHTIRNLQFATAHTSKRDCTVFFTDIQSGAFVPGVIREILSVQYPTEEKDQFEEHFFLIIHRFLPLPVDFPDPFVAFPNFGAGIWHASLEDDPVVVPCWQKVCHAIFRPWDQNTIVMKPLDREIICQPTKL